MLVTFLRCSCQPCHPVEFLQQLGVKNTRGAELNPYHSFGSNTTGVVVLFGGVANGTTAIFNFSQYALVLLLIVLSGSPNDRLDREPSAHLLQFREWNDRSRQLIDELVSTKSTVTSSHMYSWE